MAIYDQGELRLFIKEATSFIAFYMPIINCHMVDYFLKPVYDTAVSESIKNEIADLGYMNAINVLMDTGNATAPNLQKFIDNCRAFYLKNCKFCINLNTLKSKLSRFGYSEIQGTQLNIFVKCKKSHEIEVLSGLCVSLSSITTSTHFIDIGDGKGYLSSVLALQYGLSVLGVDASIKKTKGAIKRTEKLSKNWKEVRKDGNRLYKQTTAYVHAGTDVSELVNDAFDCNSSCLGLVGLHTCGDLGPNSLKLFNNNSNVKTICNVSCCYHLLTEATSLDSSSSDWGFPLSNFLIERKFNLGRLARMLSCQSIDRILHKKEMPNNVLFYRAVLQVLLARHELLIDSTKHVGKFRREPNNFEDYACEALKNLGFNNLTDNEELTKLYELHKERHSELNIFYLMRCLLAPVIESVLLMDRLLYLYENGHKHAFLVQLFDPVISPRCYGIVALKL